MSHDAQPAAPPKDRTFVRAIAGRYSEVFKGIYGQPRVYKSKDMPYREGPLHYSKPVFSPQLPVPFQTQAVEAAIEVNAPTASSPNHGHMNGAVMYVLEGTGYDIHDKERADWQAGDAFIVRPACVHQHFNTSKDKTAKLLVIKAKPLYLFFNMLFQKSVSQGTSEPGWENWKPE